MISLIVVVGVVLLIAASAYVHKTGRSTRLLTVAALVLLLLSVTAYVASPARAENSGGVRCTRFVSSSFVGPLGTGTCRVVPTKVWRSFSISAGYNWNFRFGNRDTQRVGDASSRGARDVLLSICGGVAVKYPAAGAVCAGVVGAYWWMLNNTFESATRQGKCAYVQMKSAWPRHYYPTYC